MDDAMIEFFTFSPKLSQYAFQNYKIDVFVSHHTA